MKKTFTKITFFIILAMIFTAIYSFAETKIGIIDAQKLLETTKKGKAITARIEKIGKEKQEKLQALQQQVKNLEKELMSPALNDEAREKKALELSNKKTEGKRFIEDSQRQMQMLAQKEMDKLKNEIHPIIQQVGKEKGLAVIMELTAVAYFDSTIDVTDDIIKIMDSKTGGNK